MARAVPPRIVAGTRTEKVHFFSRRARMEKRPPPSPEDVPQGPLVSVGGPVDKATVSLRVFGEDLDPVEVTGLLRCEPTRARRRGDVSSDNRNQRVAPTGSWLLHGQVSPKADLEQQVRMLLEAVSDDLKVWKDLTSRFKVDIFCGLFLEEFNHGFELSPEILTALSDRGISIGFDIYGPVNGTD